MGSLCLRNTSPPETCRMSLMMAGVTHALEGASVSAVKFSFIFTVMEELLRAVCKCESVCKCVKVCACVHSSYELNPFILSAVSI